MAEGLRKEISVSQWQVEAGGTISTRTSTKVFDGDELISEKYHRTTYNPGDDMSGADTTTQAIAAAVWTPAVVDAFMAALAAAEPETP